MFKTAKFTPLGVYNRELGPFLGGKKYYIRRKLSYEMGEPLLL
jgi:hypothetical protein